MPGVSGDFPQLQQLVDKLGALSGGSFRRDANELLAAAALAEVQMGFDQSRDPYGAAWAPLRARTGLPLRDTGRLANSYGSSGITASSFRIGTDAKYAGVHQAGATITAKTPRGLRFRVGGARPSVSGRWVTKQQVVIPKRQMVPEGDLGPLWGKAFEDELAAALQDFFR